MHLNPVHLIPVAAIRNLGSDTAGDHGRELGLELGGDLIAGEDEAVEQGAQMISETAPVVVPGPS